VPLIAGGRLEAPDATIGVDVAETAKVVWLSTGLEVSVSETAEEDEVAIACHVPQPVEVLLAAAVL
jgi:hypothetical protein